MQKTVLGAPAGSHRGLRDGHESCPLRTCPKAIARRCGTWKPEGPRGERVLRFFRGCDVESGMAKKRPSSAADYAEIASTKGRNVGCGRITHSHVVRRTTENGTSWKFAAGWTGAAHATGIGRGASAWRTIKPLT